MIAVALLAAGGGRRFGAPKLLMPAGPGETLLSRALRLALAVGDRVLCVLPGDAALHRAAISTLAQPRILFLENPDADRGMGTSLALAARAAVALGERLEALLVLPADVPGLEGRDLTGLVHAFRGTEGVDAAAAVDVEGRLGAPAVLAGHLMPDLFDLAGDAGARTLLRRDGTRVVPVPLDRVDQDIDDFAAYRRLALREGWDDEQPATVLWRDDLAREAEQSCAGKAWRIGDSLAAGPSQEGRGILGFRGPVLPRGVKRVLFAGDTVPERLALIRTAALLALRDDDP